MVRKKSDAAVPLEEAAVPLTDREACRGSACKSMQKLGEGAEPGAGGVHKVCSQSSHSQWHDCRIEVVSSLLAQREVMEDMSTYMAVVGVVCTWSAPAPHLGNMVRCAESCSNSQMDVFECGKQPGMIIPVD